MPRRGRGWPSTRTSEFLHQRLPHSKLDIIDAGHFTWEERPDEFASLITSWWAGGYQSV